MPLFTTLLENTSPLLKYSPEWAAGSSEDPLADQYTQSSFTVTDKKDANVSFSFYGTSVALYGANRANHGYYHVQLDSTTFPPVNGATSGNMTVFNSTLFISPQLPIGHHLVTLFNDNNTYLDVDYVTFSTPIGEDSEPLIANIFSSAHPSFSYTPADAWAQPLLPASFVGGYGRASNNPSATANFTFSPLSRFLSGSAVALYGPVGPNGTESFSIKVDEQSATTLSVKNEFYRSQQIIFHAGDLEHGIHTLFIQPHDGSGELAFDYAAVYSTSSLGGSYQVMTNGGYTSSTTASPGAQPPSRGLLVGVAITSIAAALSLFALVFLFIRHRRITKRLNAVTPSKQRHLSDIDFVVPSFVQPFMLMSRSSPIAEPAPSWDPDCHDPFAAVSPQDPDSTQSAPVTLTPQRRKSFFENWKDMGYQNFSKEHIKHLQASDDKNAESELDVSTETLPPPVYSVKS